MNIYVIISLIVISVYLFYILIKQEDKEKLEEQKKLLEKKRKEREYAIYILKKYKRCIMIDETKFELRFREKIDDIDPNDLVSYEIANFIFDKETYLWYYNGHCLSYPICKMLNDYRKLQNEEWKL